MPPPSTKLFHSAPKEVDFPPTLPLRKNADMRTHSHKLKGKVMFKKTGALGLQRQTVEFKREIKILSLRSAPGRKSFTRCDRQGFIPCPTFHAHSCSVLRPWVRPFHTATFAQFRRPSSLNPRPCLRATRGGGRRYEQLTSTLAEKRVGGLGEGRDAALPDSKQKPFTNPTSAGSCRRSRRSRSAPGRTRGARGSREGGGEAHNTLGYGRGEGGAAAQGTPDAYCSRHLAASDPLACNLQKTLKPLCTRRSDTTSLCQDLRVCCLR